MAENKMKEVAELLGVEMGVPFYIKDSEGDLLSYNPYVLRDGFLYAMDNDEHSSTLNYLLNGFYEIEKTILNPKEKQYLEDVLRPFKDRVISVCKEGDDFFKDNDAFINVRLNYHDNLESDEFFSLPYFHKDEMYKGMELIKEYTLQELGLFQDEI